jgi:hypothetical protein
VEEVEELHALLHQIILNLQIKVLEMMEVQEVVFLI